VEWDIKLYYTICGTLPVVIAENMPGKQKASSSKSKVGLVDL